MAYRHKKAGFTLVELSIVLVIIGLLVGGVLVGRDLIRAAEVRSVITDVEKIKTAINTFRLKYNCLPGDCMNATSYGLGANGNGNGYSGYLYSETSEWWYTWVHLSAAGLYSGSFTGAAGPAGSLNAVVGTNVPSSKIANAGYTFGYQYGYTDGNDWSPSIQDKMRSHVIFFGTSATQWTYGPALTPAEAYSIDLKIDDGMPGRGQVVHYLGTMYGNCGTSVDPTAATYRLTYTTAACDLVFTNLGK